MSVGMKLVLSEGYDNKSVTLFVFLQGRRSGGHHRSGFVDQDQLFSTTRDEGRRHKGSSCHTWSPSTHVYSLPAETPRKNGISLLKIYALPSDIEPAGLRYPYPSGHDQLFETVMMLRICPRPIRPYVIHPVGPGAEFAADEALPATPGLRTVHGTLDLVSMSTTLRATYAGLRNPVCGSITRAQQKGEICAKH